MRREANRPDRGQDASSSAAAGVRGAVEHYAAPSPSQRRGPIATTSSLSRPEYGNAVGVPAEDPDPWDTCSVILSGRAFRCPFGPGDHGDRRRRLLRVGARTPMMTRPQLITLVAAHPRACVLTKPRRSDHLAGHRHGRSFTASVMAAKCPTTTARAATSGSVSGAGGGRSNVSSQANPQGRPVWRVARRRRTQGAARRFRWARRISLVGRPCDEAVASACGSALKLGGLVARVFVSRRSGRRARGGGWYRFDVATGRGYRSMLENHGTGLPLP